MNSHRERNLKMLAALLIVLFPVTLAWLAWMALFVANHPGEEIRHALQVGYFRSTVRVRGSARASLAKPSTPVRLR
jgi:hypothetical protein